MADATKLAAVMQFRRTAVWHAHSAASGGGRALPEISKQDFQSLTGVEFGYPAQRGLVGIKVLFGIKEVRIHQTTEEQAYAKGGGKAGLSRGSVR